MRFWAAEQPGLTEAAALYAHPIAHGLFAPR
jgi:hypothetical protein